MAKGLSVISDPSRGLDLYSDPYKGGLELIPLGGGAPEQPASQPNQFDAMRKPTGGAGGSSANADDLAYLDSQEGLLRQLLDRVDPTLKQGLANLSDTFNRTQSDANQDQSRRRRDLNIKQEGAERGRDQAVNSVNTNARVLSDSVRRILSMGAGRSSALDVAGTAVAREASKNLSGVQESAAENFRGIDLARQDTESDFERFLRDLNLQKAEKERKLRVGVEGEKNSVNEHLADIARKRALLQGGGFAQVQAAQSPYANAITQGNQRIDSLYEQFRTPQLSVDPVQDRQVSLKDYIVNRAGINQQGAQQNYSPYSNFLPKRNDEELAVR